MDAAKTLDATAKVAVRVVTGFLCSLMFTSILWVSPQLIAQPLVKEVPTPQAQPIKGPGGQEYLHDSLLMFDQAELPDGFWMYVPAQPIPQEAPVVVFFHGYGGYNPMIYGAWIRHLVRKGNIVIFPRYQRNLISPKPDRFPENAAKGIRDAFELLTTQEGLPQPKLEHVSYFAHSYGGVIAAHLSVRAKAFDLPEPEAALLCAPGSGPFNGAVLDDYSGFPAHTKLLIITGERDRVVGEKFAWKLFREAARTPWRNLLRQYKDKYGKPEIEAGHNQSYALDMSFDTGKRNPTARKALRISRTDAVDFYGHWKLGDALLACSRNGQWCDIAFGGTEAQRHLGVWSDGTPIRPLDVFLPSKQDEATVDNRKVQR